MSLDDLAVDVLDDVFLPTLDATTTIEKKVIKFQPKARTKPKKPAASASNPSKIAEVLSVVETEDHSLASTSVGKAIDVSVDLPPQVNEIQETLHVDDKLTHEVPCDDGPIALETVGVLQTDPEKQEEEAIPLLAGMEPPEGIFLQPSDTAVKKVGKFQPKSCSRPKEKKASAASFGTESVSQLKEKKAKSVSFSLPDATETATSSLEAHADTQPSFVQMMNGGDKTAHSTSTISDIVDLQLDHGYARNEELADLSGIESFDSILSEPTSVAGNTVPKFRPKPGAKTKTVKSSGSGNVRGGAKGSTPSQWDALPVDIEPLEDPTLCATNLANEQADPVEMSSLDAGPSEGNEMFETIDATFDKHNYISEEREFSAVSEIIYEACSLDDNEQVQEMLDDQSKSKASEETDAGKSSRKLRNRAVAHNSFCELDGGMTVNFDEESPGDLQMGEDTEDHSDDEYRGESTSKQKKQPKKSKKQITDAQKPTKRRRKASKEPDSTEHKPPKKKLPHGTRRKRRQVDKVLLETPEYELDRRQIAIKQLILLAEARERISTNEAATLKNNQSNPDSFPNGSYFDPDNPYDEDLDPFGDEAHRNMLRNTKKVNYATHMAKPQRGRWSKSETELFYESIRQFGTDFGMIVQLFPNRTREQVKAKFKLEERKHPSLILDAMSQRSGDNSHYEKVIQILQSQAEEESRQDDENGDPTTASQDAANGNEEQRDELEKEEQEGGEFESVGADPEKLDEWGADGITDYNNEYESVGWDADGSFPQDEEKYPEFDEIF